MTIKKNLTNAELIAILMQRDPNAEVKLIADFSVWNWDGYYPEIVEEDGVCFVEDDNQLVIRAGEFEC